MTTESTDSTAHEISVLWDGGYLVAVEKPAGLSTQAPPGCDSLESRLRIQWADRSDYLAIVHRLDRFVGGVMLVALRKKEARLISDQFAARKVEKRYAAVVAGDASDVETLWRDHVRKLPGTPKAEICDASAENAKVAETRVKPIAFDAALGQTSVDLFPQTGRMHQLRVQCAGRGFPIVGDSLYGGRPSDRLMLRAESIEFHDPRNGKRVRVDGPALPPLGGFGLKE